jgi:glucose/arabinose dehydrogenase
MPSVDPDLFVQEITTGLSLPTTMGFLAYGDILVLEKSSGEVRRVIDGVLQPAPVLDVAVNASSERGLLGIAINTESPPKVFLFYTEAASDGASPIANRVYRYDWNPTLEILENPLLVLDLPVLPGANHDGGVLVLGPPGEAPGVGDGALLYAIIGDLNRNNQLQNFESSDPPDDTSVVLRVRQDGTPAPGNPFTPYCSDTPTTTCVDSSDCPGGETCVTEVARYYAYGIRNSFGMALDPVTGDLWDTENGGSTNDEVNRVSPGFNSGWQDVMGPVSTPPPSGLFDIPGAGDTYSNPEFTWTDTNAPTAIVFPFGSAMGASFDDSCLVGDNNAGQLYEFPLNLARDGFDFSAFPALQDLVADNNAQRDLLEIGSGFGVITDLKIGPDGLLYVVSLGAGAIYRLPEPGVGAGLLAGISLLLALRRGRRVLEREGLVDRLQVAATLGMPEVGRRDDARVPEPLDGGGDVGIVRVRGDEALSPEVVGRVHRESLHRDEAGPGAIRALDARLHAIEHVREPAAAGLEEHDAQAREALEHAAADHRHAHQHVAEREGGHTAAGRPVVEVTRADVERGSRARMEADRHVELRERLPQRIVELVVQRVDADGIGVHGHGAEAMVLDAAARLARGLGRVAQVERADADDALVAFATEVGEPAVVGAPVGGRRLGRERRHGRREQPDRGIHDHSVDAAAIEHAPVHLGRPAELLVLRVRFREPRHGHRAARQERRHADALDATLERVGVLVSHVADVADGHLVTKAGIQVLLPEVGRLEDVSVAVDVALAPVHPRILPSGATGVQRRVRSTVESPGSASGAFHR